MRLRITLFSERIKIVFSVFRVFISFQNGHRLIPVTAHHGLQRAEIFVQPGFRRAATVHAIAAYTRMRVLAPDARPTRSREAEGSTRSGQRGQDKLQSNPRE